MFGLFNTCRRFLCLLGPCFLIPPNLEPLLLERSVLSQTLPGLYILLAHSGSLAASMHSYTYQWLPVLRIASVSLCDVHLEYMASPLCLVYKITKSHRQTLMEERWLSTHYLLP